MLFVKFINQSIDNTFVTTQKIEGIVGRPRGAGATYPQIIE